MSPRLIDSLPEYPWDRLEPVKARASQYPGGLVDLSVGSPVDPVDASIQAALAEGGKIPGYPTAAGTPALRQAIAAWYRRRLGVASITEANVLSTVGSKEFISFLPFWLGMGPADVMVQPTVHYPAYEAGSDFVHAQVVSETDPAAWPTNTRLVWLNSPGNPDGVVNDIEYLRRAVARARELGAVIVQDECYIEFGFHGRWVNEPIPSILDPRVVGDDFTNVLSCYSLSKQSNLAGYRAAFVAGDSALVAGMINARKHAGLGLPHPIQSAMVAALDEANDAQVSKQCAIYQARHEKLLTAARAWGLEVAPEHSQAGLYVWGTRQEDCWLTLEALAGLGILGTPGSMYGETSGEFVRLSVTATDAKIDEAVQRLH